MLDNARYVNPSEKFYDLSLGWFGGNTPNAAPILTGSSRSVPSGESGLSLSPSLSRSCFSLSQSPIAIRLLGRRFYS
jgi:hypothetical protein